MTSEAYFPATAMPDADWWAALWPDPEGALRGLGIAAGQVVVDLCCGDGHFTVPLCRLVGMSGRVYGLDMDPLLLAAAKRRMQNEAPDLVDMDCRWIEADARRFDRLVAEKVDAVLLANTFHGVPDKTMLAGAVARVLKPDGRFVLINWHARPQEETTVLGRPRGPKTAMRMTPRQAGDIVSSVGFDLENVIELPPYHYGAVFRLAKH